MKRKAPVLLCLLFLTVFALTGVALADDEPACMHENVEYVYEDADTHRTICGDCGEDQGLSLHVADCGEEDYCAYCGAEGEDINFAYSDHFSHLTGFDANCCYYSCSCGEYTYEVWHSVYCDSEDANTCVECGKNTVADGIVIGDRWHNTVCGSDETYCWTICPACGYMPYIAEHYTGCCSDDETRCDNCGRAAEDGITLVWKHTALGHEDWEDEDGILMHRQTCWDCGYAGEEHEMNPAYLPLDRDQERHQGSCSGCEFPWTESHEAECGSDECFYCGAEDVIISSHINHPEGAETYVYDNENGHTITCGICGDYWGWAEHGADCDAPERCAYCGAEDVNITSFEHNIQLVGFDRELCYYRCACGEEEYDWQHVVYCDAEDMNTCFGCGRNTETDGIRIGLVWHHESYGYDENECWDTCENCGDLYRGEHYFDCDDEELLWCGYCGASADEVNISTVRHLDIDMNDCGDGRHDPLCLSCGQFLGEPHEYSLSFVNGGNDRCQVYCDVCGYLTDWGHEGQCGEPYMHTTCLRCGAEDVRVVNHGNHIGPEVADCVDEDFHRFFCSTCGEEHYWEEHKSAVGSDAAFGTCVVCGAEEVNLYGPLTYEERIEDGMRLCISYNEDGDKHIEILDAENGDYYGWEQYEHWDDEQPVDWEHRSNLVYDEENDRLTFDYESSWGSGVRTCRLSDDRLLEESGFDGWSYYKNILDEEEAVWRCTYWDSAEHERVVRTTVWTEDWQQEISAQSFAYDLRGVPGSVLVCTWEYGDEVAQDFYTHVGDAEPSQWEHFSNVVYETEELGVSGRVDVHRDFLTSEGDYGIMYFRIDNDDWFYVYEDRYLGDGIVRQENIWNEAEQLFYQNRWENDLPVHAIRMTPDWEPISGTTWEYFANLAPRGHRA